MRGFRAMVREHSTMMVMTMMMAMAYIWALGYGLLIQRADEYMHNGWSNRSIHS